MVPTPAETAACLRAMSAWLFGPGMLVTSSRRCGRLGPPRIVGASIVMLMGQE